MLKLAEIRMRRLDAKWMRSAIPPRTPILFHQHDIAEIVSVHRLVDLIRWIAVQRQRSCFVAVGVAESWGAALAPDGVEVEQHSSVILRTRRPRERKRR